MRRKLGVQIQGQLRVFNLVNNMFCLVDGGVQFFGPFDVGEIFPAEVFFQKAIVDFARLLQTQI